MHKFEMCLAVFLLALQVFAEAPEKPVSLSYLNVVKCFPELKNEAWGNKVDLNQLKEESDRKFATSNSLLRYRQVLLKDPMGQQKRMRLAAAKATKKGKTNYNLTVEKLDSKGEGHVIDLPKSHRSNPNLVDLAPYFLNQEILEDEYSYFDTKLNGITMSYKRNFKDLFEIEISDSRAHRRILCEDKKTLGVVCTCSLK